MKVKLEDLPADLLVRSVWVILGGMWETLSATRRSLSPADEREQVIAAQIDRRLEELEMLGHQLDGWLLKRKAQSKREEEERDWWRKSPVSDPPPPRASKWPDGRVE